MKSDKKPTNPKYSCCKVEGCTFKAGCHPKRGGKPEFILGFCNRHYLKFKKYGDPLAGITVYREDLTIRKHPLYGTWADIKKRCYNANSKRYCDYGERGIKVCERWLSYDGFINFVADMGDKPDASYSLDRIDNDGDYSPENCKWSSKFQQSANKRNNNPTVGVSWSVSRNKWKAEITIDKVYHFLGRFDKYEDAVRARKDAEERFGITY